MFYQDLSLRYLGEQVFHVEKSSNLPPLVIFTLLLSERLNSSSLDSLDSSFIKSSFNDLVSQINLGVTANVASKQFSSLLESSIFNINDEPIRSVTTEINYFNLLDIYLYILISSRYLENLKQHTKKVKEIFELLSDTAITYEDEFLSKLQYSKSDIEVLLLTSKYSKPLSDLGRDIYLKILGKFDTSLSRKLRSYYLEYNFTYNPNFIIELFISLNNTYKEYLELFNETYSKVILGISNTEYEVQLKILKDLFLDNYIVDSTILESTEFINSINKTEQSALGDEGVIKNPVILSSTYAAISYLEQSKLILLADELADTIKTNQEGINSASVDFLKESDDLQNIIHEVVQQEKLKNNLLNNKDQDTNQADNNSNQADNNSNQADNNSNQADNNSNQADNNSNQADNNSNQADNNSNQAGDFSKMYNSSVQITDNNIRNLVETSDVESSLSDSIISTRETVKNLNKLITVQDGVISSSSSLPIRTELLPISDKDNEINSAMYSYIEESLNLVVSGPRISNINNSVVEAENWYQKVLNKISKLKEALALLLTIPKFIRSVVASLISLLNSCLSLLKRLLTSLICLVQTALDAVKKIIKKVKKAATAAMKLSKKLKEKMDEFFQKIKDFLNKASSGIKNDILQLILDKIKGFLASLPAKIADIIRQAILSLFSMMKGVSLEDSIKKLKKVASDTLKKIAPDNPKCNAEFPAIKLTRFKSFKRNPGVRFELPKAPVLSCT